MRMLFSRTIVSVLALLTTLPVLAQDAGTTEIRRLTWYTEAACNVPTVPGGGIGNYNYYLPPDVPDPVQIAEVTIDNEFDWPSDIIVGRGGSWFAAVDPGQSYTNCSHWPGAQDCPIVNTGAPAGSGGNQFYKLNVLGQLAIGQEVAYSAPQRPIYYHRGDSIIIGTPCITQSGSTASRFGAIVTFGLSFPKYTPTTACDTNTKLLLHGKQYPSPVDRVPLPHFVADSSPSWHPVATMPAGGSVSNVLIDTTTVTLGQSSSIAFDGTINTGAWINASGDFLLGESDWTLEMFWYPRSNASPFQQLWGWKGYGGFVLGQWGNQYYLGATSNGTSWNVANASWGTVTLNTWNHLVVQRSGNQLLLSQDGVLQQTIPVSGKLFDALHSPVYLGNSSTNVNPANGNIQELRFSTVARFPSGSYTVPASPYPCP